MLSSWFTKSPELFLKSLVIILKEVTFLKLLILAGVDNAGKSITIRHATKYLAINPDVSMEFVKEPYKNMRKRFMINDTPVYIYCSSPQEMAQGNKERCRTFFEKRIRGREPKSLVIMPFNLESKYEESIEVCLQEINIKDLKANNYFVFLNAEHVKNNDQAKSKLAELEQRDYSVIGKIQRLENRKDEQGKMFADYVKEQIPKP